MKLATFERDGKVSFGSVRDGLVFDFRASVGPGETLRDYLPAGLSVWQGMEDAALRDDRVPLDAVKLLAPVPNARKYLGLGGNYSSHMEEAAKAGFVRPRCSGTWPANVCEPARTNEASSS